MIEKTMSYEQDQVQIQLTLDSIARRKNRIGMVLPYFGVVLLIVFFTALTNGKFLKGDNIELLLNQCFTTVIVVMGCAFLYAEGCLDMAVGSVMGISSMVLTLCLIELHLPLVVSFLIGAIVSVVFMSITALTKNILKVEPFVASMCVNYVCSGIIQVRTAKGNMVFPFSSYAYLNEPLIKIMVIIILGAVCAILFNRTRIGKNLKIMGGSTTVARISGINLNLYNWLAYAICAITLAIAGLFSVIRVGQVDNAAGAGLSLNIITAVVLGGSPLTGGTKSRFLSPILGAIMVTLLTNGLSIMGYSNSIGYLLKGLIFLVVVGITYERSKGKLIA